MVCNWPIRYCNCMKIILYQPQIPQNTGNIVRTCAVTGSELILVRPLGFNVTDRWLKRAGLDYWDGVNVKIIDDLESLLTQTSDTFYFFSSKASKRYDQVSYKANDWLIFGSETEGLPPHFVTQWPERFLTIPMIPGCRCLNLATSVGIVVYESWKQQSFFYRENK
jgi:tRNA (cytidine/uridine-2'-O-)-methyltransferase